MKENKYDDNIFFQKYSQMSRSQQGLAGAGEWETLRKLLPDFKDKRVLDLGPDSLRHHAGGWRSGTVRPSRNAVHPFHAVVD